MFVFSKSYKYRHQFITDSVRFNTRNCKELAMASFCSKCNKGFHNKSNLRRHTKDMHPGEQNNAEFGTATLKEKISNIPPIKKARVNKIQKRTRTSKCKLCLRNIPTCYLKRHVNKFCKSRSEHFENFLSQELLDNDVNILEMGQLIDEIIYNSRTIDEELVPEHKQALEMYR